jgi:hypothetical protein
MALRLFRQAAAGQLKIDENTLAEVARACWVGRHRALIFLLVTE